MKTFLTPRSRRKETQTRRTLGVSSDSTMPKRQARVCGPISAQPHAIPWSIRLIRLRPSFDLSAPLELNLLEVLLEDFPSKVNSYEAHSYVWGALTGTVPCRSEGKELLITPNCNEALQHLRLPDNDRVPWVDAICIDQGSSEE
jgi:hypothetical protein